jgi:hypothetical protein
MIPIRHRPWLFGGLVMLAVVAVFAQTVLAQSKPDNRRAGVSPLARDASDVCAGRINHVPGGPDGTGKCWPGPTNVGVPAGTTLTDYTGSCTIATPNTVIDSKAVNCNLLIRAANVRILKSKVNGNVILDVDLPGSSAWSFTLQDSEVDGGQIQLSAVGWGNLTVLRSNIHGGQTSVQCEENSVSCVVQDSYLHGQYIPPGEPWHLGGFLSDGGQRITLRHNFVVCDQPVNSVGEGCTGDINLIPNFAPIKGALIEHNLFGANIGSSYCTYGGEKSTSATPNSFDVVYKDNVFQRGLNGKCAAFGPVTDFQVRNSGNQWTNNRWDNGVAINPDGSTATEAPDTDRDGLSDEAEARRYHTDPRLRDTDGDGLADDLEVLRYRTDARERDTDRDGLTDSAEIRRYHTDPRKPDTDRDGLTDSAEIRRYHTDPRKRDTDRDGLTDGAEVLRYKTSPRKRDTDADGWTDSAETRAHTDPRNRRSRPGAPTP